MYFKASGREKIRVEDPLSSLVASWGVAWSRTSRLCLNEGGSPPGLPQEKDGLTKEHLGTERTPLTCFKH